MKSVAAVIALMAIAGCAAPSTDAMDHMHAVAVTDAGVFVGSHNGLWQIDEVQPPKRVSDQAWDVMGLDFDGKAFVGSGHPGPNMDAPGDLGLQRSTDGRAWQGVSLVGEVDFHRISALDGVIAGIDAHSEELLTSADGGQTWRIAPGGRYGDVVVLPDGAVIAFGPGLRAVSSDSGMSWDSRSLNDPFLTAVTRADSGVLAVTDTGELLRLGEPWGSWQPGGSLGESAIWLASHGETIAAIVNGRVLVSQDAGESFASWFPTGS